MSKIKLNLNQLKVDSFETAESKNVSGTVKGFRPPDTEDEPCITEVQDTCFYTCESCISCIDTCQNTCDPNVGTCCIHC